MRHEQEFDADVRSSALWGKGGRGERRSSALWGKGGRGLATAAVATLTLALPLAAGANGTSARKDKGDTYIAPAVLQAAAKDPNGTVHVIVQSTSGAEGGKNTLQGLGNLKKEFRRTGMVSAEIPASKLDKLAESSGLTVTLDAEVKKADYTSNELWVHQNGASKLWPSASSAAPRGATIAFIDSGIEKDLPSFGNGSRIVDRQVFATLPQGSARDGRGHGSFVAGIASG